MIGKRRVSLAPLSREVRVLCLCQSLLSFGLGLAFPFFAIYLNRERGLPMTLAGGGLSLAVLATALSQWLGGELSDRYGRRLVMVSALWARALTVAVLAYAIWAKLPVAVVVGIHLISNFVSHFFEPASRGWIADHTPPADRYRAYGLLKSATHFGFAVGPAIGGLVADASYSLLYQISAVICVLCAVAATALLRSDAPRPVSKADPEKEYATRIDANFMQLCALTAFLGVAMAQFVVPLSLWATRFLGLRDSQMGYLLSINGLLVVAFQLPAVNLFAGVRLTAAIAIGTCFYAAGYIAVGWSGGMAGLVAAVVLLSVAELLVPSGVQALAANMSPVEVRGRWIGILGLSRQAGSALGPVLGCWAMETAAARGLPGHWIPVAGVALAAGVGYLLLGKRLLPDEEGLVEEGNTTDETTGLGLGT